MFNLPWYSWLNVLALPVMWLCMTVDFSISDAPSWMRKTITYYIFASTTCIFLYWNQMLFETLTPLNYLLLALIAPFSLWNVYCGVVCAGQSLLVTEQQENDGISVATGSPETAAADFDVTADELDLDEVFPCAAHARQHDEMAGNIHNMLSPDSSSKQRFKSFVDLFDDAQETDGSAIAVSVGIAIMYTATCLPPLYMSLQLLE